jgi:hypothetical protein
MRPLNPVRVGHGRPVQPGPRGPLRDGRRDGKRRQVLKDNRRPSDADSAWREPSGSTTWSATSTSRWPASHAYSPPFRNALKGGWWMAARNRCRPATTAHDDFYEDTQIGVRCCADVPGEAEPTG